MIEGIIMFNENEKFLVIDTETCNTIEQPLPYDIGYAICDRNGKIYLERSFVVAEMFLDRKDLMQSAYFAEKIPNYWEDIKNGTREIKSIFNIRKQLHKDMKDFRVKKVGAYNMGFDKRALNNVIRYCSKSLIRWFFPFGIEFFCIWNIDKQIGSPKFSGVSPSLGWSVVRVSLKFMPSLVGAVSGV